MLVRTTTLGALLAGLLAVPAASAVAGPRGNDDRIERRLEQRSGTSSTAIGQVERRDRRVERHDGPRAEGSTSGSIGATASSISARQARSARIARLSSSTADGT